MASEGHRQAVGELARLAGWHKALRFWLLGLVMFLFMLVYGDEPRHPSRSPLIVVSIVPFVFMAESPPVTASLR